MKNNDEILIGACDVYMYEFTGTEIPEHATIETEEHDVGKWFVELMVGVRGQ